MDTKRKYLYYPEEVMPDYALKHSLSVVYKQFIPFLSSSFGITYLYGSGRPYYNPNNPDFMSDITDDYHNLSINMSWLKLVRNNFFVVTASVTNILGFDNIYGYQRDVKETLEFKKAHKNNDLDLKQSLMEKHAWKNQKPEQQQRNARERFVAEQRQKESVASLSENNELGKDRKRGQSNQLGL